MLGKLIVIDGVDGSGKTTQIKMLLERMTQEQLPFSTIKFPRYGQKSAAPVEEYLAGTYGDMKTVGAKQASIFYAVDRYAASFEIRDHLERGTHVILDRYVSANMGHQGAHINDPEERKKFFLWNDELEHNIFNIPRPHINIILHVPVEVSIRLITERGEKKDIIEQDVLALANAEKSFIEMTQLYADFHLIECFENNTLLLRETIHQKIWQVVQPILVSQKIPA